MSNPIQPDNLLIGLDIIVELDKDREAYGRIVKVATNMTDTIVVVLTEDGLFYSAIIEDCRLSNRVLGGVFKAPEDL